MSTPESHSKQVLFTYVMPALTSKHQSKIEIPIEIPFGGCTKELTSRIISMFKLPCYIERDLYPALKAFVEKETLCLHDDVAEKYLEEVKEGDVSIENEIVKAWEAAFREETLEYGKPSYGKYKKDLKNGEHLSVDWSSEDNSINVDEVDEVTFAAAYHSLVHSPSLSTVLKFENAHARALQRLAAQRDEEIAALDVRQAEEMSRAVEAEEEGREITLLEDESGLIEGPKSPSQSEASLVSHLICSHFEEQHLLHGGWASRMETLQTVQKERLRGMVMALSRGQTNGILLRNSVSTGTSDQDMDNCHKEDPLRGEGDEDRNEFDIEEEELLVDLKDRDKNHPSLLEESFTIHLGSQMKQMHNIRILAAPILHFCRSDYRGCPERLQTALSLYSNDLHGIVLLTDNSVAGYTGINKEFTEVCQMSTEFHFQPVEEQMEKIRGTVKEAVAWREQNAASFLSLHGAKGGDNAIANKGLLQTGDVYVTKHSNLSQVHVVFHLVVADSTLRSGDINSRHPAILGIRNILKMACMYDVTTLTLPVLLMHDMSEDMTVAWCTRRAELVLKCVKGFMIEMASWGGSQIKNLQFLVPKGISDEVFGILATMLPSIFRVSNPLVFKASSTGSGALPSGGHHTSTSSPSMSAHTPGVAAHSSSSSPSSSSSTLSIHLQKSM
ncbi:protein C12orf4 homolog [Ischnura elegans]|uniref:protein C12orf4 homolog n=1 Tax=Ischnura elegans TaxID=197161 RepID=UPI001ED86A25|nr:protein C12orf4 homolog [Ischnura elegans]